jgi:pyruvate/2-oxoglutarate dehydrogenase complex dihydrolipoamide acyltransferase (E2) component
VAGVEAPRPARQETASSTSAEASAGVTEEIVNAPIEGENVVVSFRVKVGDQVQADDVIAEIESDKASVDVSAPTAGTVTKFFITEHQEINVTTETKICSIEAGDVTVVDAAAGTTEAVEHAPGTAEETSAGEGVTQLSRVQLAMVDNMTVKVGDTKTYTVGENVNFSSVLNLSKQQGVSPTAALVKFLADSVQSLSINKKLSNDKRSMRTFSNSVDIGVAVEVDGQLRVAVLRDASSKSMTEIGADMEVFKAKGSKLSPEDQNLDSVCFVLSSLGKHAPTEAYATLPRGLTGILAIGRKHEERSSVIMTLCHATLTGSEGARLMSEVARRTELR